MDWFWFDIVGGLILFNVLLVCLFALKYYKEDD